MQGRNRRCRVGILDRRRQVGMGQFHGGTVAMPPAPALRVMLDPEIQARPLDPRPAFGQGRQQARGRIQLAHDRWPVAPRDTGFLATDAVAIRPQPVHVVQVHGGDDRHVRIDDVHRVQAPAKTHLQHCHVDAGTGKQVQRGQRAEFEVGQRQLAAGRLDPFERRDQGRVLRQGAVDADALVVDKQMRRSEGAHAATRSRKHGLQQGDGGALAIGASHGDHARRRTGRAHPLPHLAHPIEPQLDAVHVDAFLVAQPLGEGAGHERVTR